MAKFKTFIGSTSNPITESSSMLFKDYEQIKLDPDRDDLWDLTNKIMPFMIKASYVNLIHKKNDHERKHGTGEGEEDPYLFTDFNKAGLVEEIENYISTLVDRLKDISAHDIEDAIESVASTFPTPLESKK